MDTLTRWLPIDWPLIQAPMAGCQDEDLALAVGGAGALGSLPAALLDAAALDAALGRLRAVGRPFNVNFFAHGPTEPDPHRLVSWHRRLAPYYDEAGLAGPPAPAPGRRAFDSAAAEVLQAHRPAVVSFHFGLPAPPLLARVRSTGAFVLATATTPDEARWLQARGADGVIAQGLEAGGHRGHFLHTDISRQLPLEHLLPAVRAAVSVPVVAAGGIASADDVRHWMSRGAAAVQVGTAFLLCDEATTPALHRRRLADAAAPTVLTNLFTGGVARGLANRLTQEQGGLCDDAPPFPWASASIAPLRQWAESRGRDDFSPLWSGTNRQGLAPGPAADRVRSLVAGLADR